MNNPRPIHSSFITAIHYSPTGNRRGDLTVYIEDRVYVYLDVPCWIPGLMVCNSAGKIYNKCVKAGGYRSVKVLPFVPESEDLTGLLQASLEVAA